MSNKIPGTALVLLCLALVSASALPLPGTYPRLTTLGPGDPIYQQQQEQLAASYTALAAGVKGPDLVIYRFVATSELDLFSLAARLNLPYETLATLNGLDRARAIVPGEGLLIPSAPGIFVSEDPASDLDYLLSYRAFDDGEALQLASSAGSGRPTGLKAWRFYRGARFKPEERAMFLGFLFRFPLPRAQVSSGFGMRVNPVTGHAAFHHGIDLAAPSGTEVYAAREGLVTACGVDAVLGQYIVIDHEGKWQTVYGHLSLRLVRLNDRVESGMIIGRVGTTGQSTGPHLHFEVRNQGEARDPQALIPKVKR